MPDIQPRPLLSDNLLIGEARGAGVAEEHDNWGETLILSPDLVLLSLVSADVKCV